MPAIVQRCVQCGSPTEYEASRVPLYGARLRCPECGNLLPLLLPATIQTPPPEMGEAATRDPDDRSAAPSIGDPEGASAGTRTEARNVLELWVREVRRTAAAPLTETRLREEHREELDRLRDLWRSSFPDPESIRIFEEELRATLWQLGHG